MVLTSIDLHLYLSISTLVLKLSPVLIQVLNFRFRWPRDEPFLARQSVVQGGQKYDGVLAPNKQKVYARKRDLQPLIPINNGWQSLYMSVLLKISVRYFIPKKFFASCGSG